MQQADLDVWPSASGTWCCRLLCTGEALLCAWLERRALETVVALQSKASVADTLCLQALPCLPAFPVSEAGKSSFSECWSLRSTDCCRGALLQLTQCKNCDQNHKISSCHPVITSTSASTVC